MRGYFFRSALTGPENIAALMLHDQSSSHPEKSLEHTRLCPQSSEELARAVDLAFDYRGDVTVELKSGSLIEGYMFSRVSDHPEPFIELYLKGQMEKCVVKYAEIAGITFSGVDTALGTSWEAWIKKKKEEHQKKNL